MFDKSSKKLNLFFHHEMDGKLTYKEKKEKTPRSKYY